MEPAAIIEIRYSRIILRLIILILLFVFIISNYVVYVSNEYNDKPFLKYVYILLDIYLIYMLYKNTLRLFKNKPILILTNEFIEINEGKEPVRYMWIEINTIRIERDSNYGKGYYLILKTVSSTKSINLNWLERPPDQIEEMISTMKNQSVSV